MAELEKYEELDEDEELDEVRDVSDVSYDDLELIEMIKLYPGLRSVSRICAHLSIVHVTFTIENARICVKRNAPLVCGTTV